MVSEEVVDNGNIRGLVKDLGWRRGGGVEGRRGGGAEVWKGHDKGQRESTVKKRVERIHISENTVKLNDHTTHTTGDH